MTYHRVCNWSNTTVVTCGAGTAFPSGAPEFTPCFFTSLSGVRVVHVVKLHVFTFLFPDGGVRYDVRFVLSRVCFVEFS